LIFGVGTDIVDVSRIQKSIQGSVRFAQRILTEAEQQEYDITKYPERFLAKRFAAKEALVKAMGTGIGRGISWKMAQINHRESGQPYFEVFDGIKEFFEANNIQSAHLSISDEQEFATAFVVLEMGQMRG